MHFRSAKSGSSGAYPWLAERSQPAQSAKRDDEGLQDSAQVANGDHSELDPTAAANALMKQLVDVLRQSSFLKARLPLAWHRFQRCIPVPNILHTF